MAFAPIATSWIRPLLKPLAAIAMASLITSITSARQQFQAVLSNELVAVLRLDPFRPARVVATGEVTELKDVAARHRLIVLRTLDQSIVVEANSLQVAALQQEAAVKVLSSDREITADQNRSSVPNPISECFVSDQPTEASVYQPFRSSLAVRHARLVPKETRTSQFGYRSVDRHNSNVPN